MSAEPMIRELFRGLETTLHERLSLVEQILNTIEKPKIPLYDNEFVKRIERLEQNQMRHSHDSNIQFLESRICALEEQLASTHAELMEMKLNKTIIPEKENAYVDVDVHVEEEEELIIPDEEEELVVEEEQEGLELEEFEYKGTKYYKDSDNNVYTTDDDGDVIPDPIARWNGTKLLRIV